MDYFNYYGRDVETKFAKVKIAYRRCVFFAKPDDETIITKQYIDNDLKLYLSNREVKEREKMYSRVLYRKYT